MGLLARIGVKPEDVRHVILSHLRWDRYAGDNFYPHARYHVHQKEPEQVTGPLMRFHTYAQHYNFKAIENLLHMQFSGRVDLLQDDSESICDGITCIRTGGHTPGLLSTAVETGRDTKVISSDVVPRYRNIMLSPRRCWLLKRSGASPKARETSFPVTIRQSRNGIPKRLPAYTAFPEERV